MSDVKSLETSRANVEMIEKPDQIVTPDSELNHDIEGADAEERTTAKAWLCVFVGSASASEVESPDTRNSFSHSPLVFPSGESINLERNLCFFLPIY